MCTVDTARVVISRKSEGCLSKRQHFRTEPFTELIELQTELLIEL